MKYYRITEILSPFSDFGHIDPNVLENAADRGSRVHKFCELYANNMLIMEPDEDCKGYVHSFKNWFDSVVDKVIFTEKRLFCDELMITGQIDMMVKIKYDPIPYIVDLKTPQQSNKSWMLQTAGYKYLICKNEDISDLKRGCLMLDRYGKIATFKEYDSKKDGLLFLQAVALYKFFNKEPKESI